MTLNTPNVVLIQPDQADAGRLAELTASLGVSINRHPDVASWTASLATPKSPSQGQNGATQPQSSKTNGSTNGSSSSGGSIPVGVVLAGPLPTALADGQIQAARAAAGDIPVIAYCQPTSAAEAVEGMRQGLADILFTDSPPEKLSKSLQQIVEEGRRAGALAAEKRELRGRLEQLTDAENEVLDAMLKGMANKQIAQLLQIGLRTVELRRSKIMRKMQAKSLAELVKFVCIAREIGQSAAGETA